MRHRKSVHRATEPSLVPLADMLTNTVGIMLFILAFTVLTTGGAVIAKRLPLMHKTEAKALHFLCSSNEITPLDLSMSDKLPEAIGIKDVDGAQVFLRKFNVAEVEDDYFVVKGEGEIQYAGGSPRRLALSARFDPKAGKGTPASEIDKPNSPLMEALRTNSPTERYFHFFVRPDQLQLFYKARDIAARSNFSCGWFPMGATNPVMVSVNGVGGAASGPQ